jgi:predicted dehydrogenase
MREIRFGIVGAGNWAIGRAQHFAAIDGCRVTLGWSRSAASRERFSRETGAPAAEEWQAVCASPDVDAVVVATPHIFHYEQARAALLAGKHVMVETPLCLHYHEARELADIAERQGLVVHHATKARYHPDHAREIADLRRAGTMLYAESTACYDAGPERLWYRDFALSGGGFALMPYNAVNFFELFGEAEAVEGRHVQAQGRDVATMCVRFAGGGQAVFTYGTGADLPDVDRGLIIGSEGIVEWRTGTPKTLTRGEETVEFPPLRQVDLAACECRAFVDEIRGARDFRWNQAVDLRILKAVSEARERARPDTA